MHERERERERERAGGGTVYRLKLLRPPLAMGRLREHRDRGIVTSERVRNEGGRTRYLFCPVMEAAKTAQFRKVRADMRTCRRVKVVTEE